MNRLVGALVILVAVGSPEVCVSETPDTSEPDPIRYRIVCEPNRKDPQAFLNGVPVDALVSSHRLWYLSDPIEFRLLELDFDASNGQRMLGNLIDYRGRKAVAQNRVTEGEQDKFTVLANEWDCQLFDSTKSDHGG
jgi:hypothetical protein